MSSSSSSRPVAAKRPIHFDAPIHNSKWQKTRDPAQRANQTTANIELESFANGHIHASPRRPRTGSKPHETRKVKRGEF
jgi:hypothetical protein